MPKIPEESKKHIELTERDSVLFLNLLDEPPAPNTKLMEASFALPKQL